MQNSKFFDGVRPLPAAISHVGRSVILKPQDPERDAADLFQISHGTPQKEAIWQYLPTGPFSDEATMREFLQQWGAAPDVVAFTVRDAAAGTALGSISLMNVRPAHGVAELGNIWFTPAAQRTRANTEANYLLLHYCFEELGYRRMEWKCDSRNEPSRRAALRLGYRYDGTFQQHMIVKGGNRDTTWFALLDHEWPEVKSALKRKLD